MTKFEFTDREVYSLITSLQIHRISLESSAKVTEELGVKVPDEIAQEIQHLLSLENKLKINQLELELGVVVENKSPEK